MPRKQTRKIFVGSVPIGGGAPVPVQSMTNTNTLDWRATASQIKRLEEVGCEIIRVAVESEEAAKMLPFIKKEINIPLIADIDKSYGAAIWSIKLGADGIRINPKYFRGIDKIKEIIKAALEHNVIIRIGVNSGSVEGDLLKKYGHPTPEALVESALRYIRIFEEQGFELIKVSLKSSDVLDTIAAYRKFSECSDYPLHLGVTEAGLPIDAAVKSALGIGMLLYEGIGDTFRVSITGDPEIEMQVAYDILRALKIRQVGIDFISCPTCGRTKFNLIELAKKAHQALIKIRTPLKVAVMGCWVNGPGEAKEADVGIGGGRGTGGLFKKGKKIEEDILEEDLLGTLLREVEEMTGEKISS